MSDEIAGHVAIDDQADSSRKADGAISALKTVDAMPHPPPSPTVTELIELQRRRVHAIRAQSFCDRSCDAFVARYLGYHSGLPEKERKALMQRAADMRESIEKQYKAATKRNLKSKTESWLQQPWLAAAQAMHDIVEQNEKAGGRAGSENLAADASVCSPIIVNTISSRSGWDSLREQAEKRMVELAVTLPVWKRCAQVPGLGEIGLASIVAEAGNDLTAYPHHYHLNKRLGLAPYQGKAMSRYAGSELSKDEWTQMGYVGRRLGRIWGDVCVPLFMKKADNAYGQVYTERREHTALTHPEWSKIHSDWDARRIMLKALIKDVLYWWHEAAAAAEQREAA